MEDTNRDIVLIAHRRWYKTRLGIMKTLYGNSKHKGALKDPKTDYFIVLPTYKQAKMVAWDILKDESKAYSPKINESELLIVYPNGSKIALKGADKPDSLRGPGLDGCVFDEWAFFEKPEVATRIVRPALADKQGWWLKETTLNGNNHAWDDYQNAESKYMFKASESGVLPDDELMRMRNDMPEDEYLQEMECIPMFLAGQIYKEFGEIHLCDPVKPKADWNFVVGLDWGISHNSAIIFCAVDYDGTLYVYDELVDNDKPVDYYAPIIKHKMEGIKYLFPISPDTLKADKFRNGIRYSVYDEFCEQGLDPVLANNQVHAGINKTKQLFASRKIKICRNCTELIAGLKRYKWKAGADEPAKVKDDEVDAMRYAIATYFEAPIHPAPKTETMSQEWWEIMEKKQKKREMVDA